MSLALTCSWTGCPFALLNVLCASLHHNPPGHEPSRAFLSRVSLFIFSQRAGISLVAFRVL
jgi:hypothetical protein